MEGAEPGKRILYVITKATWGGAQRYVYDLATAMQAKGHEVALAYGEGGLLTEKLASHHIRSLSLPALKQDIKFTREWQAFGELKKLITDEKPDIIHINSSKGGLAILAARFAKVPRIIFTAHGWAFNEARPWWQRMVFRVIYAISLLFADITIAVSEAVRNDMKWVRFFGKKIITISLGIEAPAFLKRADAQKKLGELGGRTLIGMLAELHPTKRVQDAIYAIAELKPTYPNLKLIVLGEGKEREPLSAIINELRLSDSVILKGFMDDAATLLPAFDMFLMPSRTEALGYAAIEAGFAGLPVIASRAGGLPEIIRHKETGLLVPPENPHALARAMRILLDEPEYTKHLAQCLKERVTEKFKKERMVNETKTVYES